MAEIKLVIDDPESTSLLAAILATVAEIRDRLTTLEAAVTNLGGNLDALEGGFVELKRRIDEDVAHLLDINQQLATTHTDDVGTISRLRADATDAAQRIEALTAAVAGVDPDPNFPTPPAPEPQPEPTPEPEPVPQPEPTPEPTPNPEPVPTPEPVPGTDGGGAEGTPSNDAGATPAPEGGGNTGTTGNAPSIPTEGPGTGQL